MLIRGTDGQVHEVEGIDVNVWDTGVYGSGPDVGMKLTGYPMFKDENGLWDTLSGVILFSVETDFDRERHDEDAWYGWSGDMTPGDMPAEVRVMVDSIVRELTVKVGSDRNPVLAYARRHPGENILYANLTPVPSEVERYEARNILARLANARRAV